MTSHLTQTHLTTSTKIGVTGVFWQTKTYHIVISYNGVGGSGTLAAAVN